MASKYRNQKTNGYDSKKEASIAASLEALQKDGIIYDLQKQVKFELIPKQEGERAVYYIADFTYHLQINGLFVVADVKSAFTRKNPLYIVKRKLMKWRHKITIEEI